MALSDGCGVPKASGVGSWPGFGKNRMLEFGAAVLGVPYGHFEVPFSDGKRLSVYPVRGCEPSGSAVVQFMPAKIDLRSGAAAVSAAGGLKLDTSSGELARRLNSHTARSTPNPAADLVRFHRLSLPTAAFCFDLARVLRILSSLRRATKLSRVPARSHC